MAEYIEREALVNFIESHFPYRCSCDFYDGQKDCINQINAFPAADVVEVVHGEWREVDQTGRNPRHIQYTTKQCSVCGYWNGRRKTNYCPNCGADMRGERRNNK